VQLGLKFRNMLPNVVREELDSICAIITAFWNVEHNADGTHGNITAKSLIINGKPVVPGQGGGAASLPTTTQGDLIVHDVTTNVRLPVGSIGRVLTADPSAAEGVSWQLPTGPQNLPVPISQGGTGQTSKTPAFDALAPGTAKGDLIAYDGADNVRVPVGTLGQVLTADPAPASGMAWKAPAPDGGPTTVPVPIAQGGTGQTTKQPAFDALSPATTKGDLILYGPTGVRLPVGADGSVLTADAAQATGVKWQAPAAIPSVPLTTKGDLLGFTSVNARVPVGANGSILTADSAAAPGVSWQAAPVATLPADIVCDSLAVTKGPPKALTVGLAGTPQLRFQTTSAGNPALASNFGYDGTNYFLDDQTKQGGYLFFGVLSDGSFQYYPIPAGTNPRPAPSFPAFIVTNTGQLKERARTVALGEWIDIPYAAGNYTPAAWVVAAGDQLTLSYTLIGRTCILNFRLETMSVTTAQTELALTLPAAITAVGQNPFVPIAGMSAGAALTAPCAYVAGAQLRFRMNRTATTSWPVQTDTLYLLGSIAFEI